MKAFILALALFLSVAVSTCEPFTTDNAVFQYDADGAYQIIFWNPSFSNFLNLENGIMEIGSVSKHPLSSPVASTGELLNEIIKE
jgi:hypothetical protein